MSNGDRYNQVRDDSSRHFTGATATSSNSTAEPAESSSVEWRRFSLLRAWIWLELPVVLVISIVVAVLAVMYLTNDAYEVLRKIFTNMSPDVEPSVGTWLNSVLWMAAGLVAGYIALHVRERRASWAAVSAVSIFFSLDEAVMLHDRLSRFSADLGQIVPVATFVWIIPGALFALVVAGLLLRMILSLPRRSRNALLAGGAIFMFGTIIMEGIGGIHYFSLGGEEFASTAYSYIALTMVEEICEMTGVALAIAAMLHLIEWRRSDGAMAYRVNVQHETGSAAPG